MRFSLDYYEYSVLVKAAMAYMVSAFIDDTLTYVFVVLGPYSEANPFAAWIISRGLYFLWPFIDLLALLLVIGVGLAARYFLIRVGGVYKLWFIIPVAAATVRALPVIHNVLLVVCGIETPLSKIFVTH